MSIVELGAPFWFLLPERQDSRPEFGSGARHDAAAIKELLLRLQALAGGATRGLGRGEVRGVWSSIEDVSIRFELGLPSDREDALVRVLAWAARRFGQECLYAVVAAGRRAVLIYREDFDAGPFA